MCWDLEQWLCSWKVEVAAVQPAMLQNAVGLGGPRVFRVQNDQFSGSPFPGRRHSYSSFSSVQPQLGLLVRHGLDSFFPNKMQPSTEVRACPAGLVPAQAHQLLVLEPWCFLQLHTSLSLREHNEKQQQRE